MEHVVGPDQLRASLDHLDYPVGRSDLLEAGGADGTLLRVLRLLPDRTYHSVLDVAEILGEEGSEFGAGDGLGAWDDALPSRTIT